MCLISLLIMLVPFILQYKYVIIVPSKKNCINKDVFLIINYIYEIYIIEESIYSRMPS